MVKSYLVFSKEFHYLFHLVNLFLKFTERFDLFHYEKLKKTTTNFFTLLSIKIYASITISKK